MGSVSNRRFGAFSSSDNPDELASTVKGVILATGTIVIWTVGRLFNIELTTTDIVDFATQAGGAAASIWIAYGVVKKIVVWAIAKWHTRTV